MVRLFDSYERELRELARTVEERLEALKTMAAGTPIPASDGADAGR